MYGRVVRVTDVSPEQTSAVFGPAARGEARSGAGDAFDTSGISPSPS